MSELGVDDFLGGETRAARLFLDVATEPFATFKPPARTRIDTTKLADGEHTLVVEATDTSGTVGRREIPFVVRNGPAISVLGVRPNEIVQGTIDVQVDAFSGGSHSNFNPVQAESQRPTIVTAWVLLPCFRYGRCIAALLTSFRHLRSKPGKRANRMHSSRRTSRQPRVQTPVPRFTRMAPRPVSTRRPSVRKSMARIARHATVLPVRAFPASFHRLSAIPLCSPQTEKRRQRPSYTGCMAKSSGGKPYGGQMPAYAAQLTDAEIAAVIDHERTSWGQSAGRHARCGKALR